MHSGWLCQRYSVVDTTWAIATNSADILACAAASFPGEVKESRHTADFALRIVVDDRLIGRVDAAPLFRGRRHLVLARYANAGFFAIDMQRRIAFGVVSPELARDVDYWRESVFPVLLGLMCLVLDAVPLHTACIERNGRGVLIAGPSGAGKSTLAATLAGSSFPYVSDDWVYLSGRTGRVHACPINMKLMPDAIVRFFPELAGRRQSIAMNGEVSVSLDPADAFGARRVFSCDPDVIVLLERRVGCTTQVRRASADDLAGFFSEPLDCVPTCFEADRRRQIGLIRMLADREAYMLTSGGTPTEIAASVLSICDQTVDVGPAVPAVFHAAAPLDLLRRHAVVPHRGRAKFGDESITIASDDLDSLRLLPAGERDSAPAIEVDLLIEGDGHVSGPDRFTFSHANLVGCAFGDGGCVLLDTDLRFGMAFVSRQTIGTGMFAGSIAHLLGLSTEEGKVTVA